VEDERRQHQVENMERQREELMRRAKEEEEEEVEDQKRQQAQMMAQEEAQVNLRQYRVLRQRHMTHFGL
jgi:hypothetical protein